MDKINNKSIIVLIFMVYFIATVVFFLSGIFNNQISYMNSVGWTITGFFGANLVSIAMTKLI